jgi:hypothetical protein
VHPPQYLSLPEDLGIQVAPGAQTFVSIKQTQIKRMPLPYDGTDCGDATGYKPGPLDIYAELVFFVFAIMLI